MQITTLADSCVYGQSGTFRGYVRFENPRLHGYQWPLCEIRGSRPGPLLCVSAGVHVNEVSSIEAAVRLQRLFDPQRIRGCISIMPLVNQPALYKYAELECPLDNKNINHTFPGRPDGTFSDALCDAIMNEWCCAADCLVDMHGGNFRENVSKFSIFQRTPERVIDARARELAMCFDAEIVLGLPPSYMERSGRPPTAFAHRKQIALMSEAGANGVLTEEAISFHVNGVLNVARTLGITDTPPPSHLNARVECSEYVWVASPKDGQFYSQVEPGERIEKGQTLGTIRSLLGENLAEISAPAAGLVLWRITHPSIPKGDWVLAIAVEEQPRRRVER